MAKWRRCEAELSDATQRLAFGSEEARRLEARAEELLGQLEATRAALDEARASVESEGEARRAVIAEKELAAKAYEDARVAQQQGQLALHEMRGRAERAEGALVEREADAAQLKTLVARMELAHAEMAAKLDTALSKLSESQAATAAEATVRETAASALANKEASLRELRELVGALDRERDGLALQVDEKAEEVHRLRQQAEASLQKAADNERQLLSARDQCNQQAKLLTSLEAGKEAVASQLQVRTLLRARPPCPRGAPLPRVSNPFPRPSPSPAKRASSTSPRRAASPLLSPRPLTRASHSRPLARPPWRRRRRCAPRRAPMRASSPPSPKTSPG